MIVLRPFLAGCLAVAVALAAPTPAEAARKHAPHVQLAKVGGKPHAHRAHVMDTVARRFPPATRHTGLVMTRNTASTAHHSPGPA